MTNNNAPHRRPRLDHIDAANYLAYLERRRAHLTMLIVRNVDLAIELATEHHDRADAMIASIHSHANAVNRNMSL